MSLRADPDSVERSASWDVGPPPRISVVVSTFNRAEFLPGLLVALAEQDVGTDSFDVTIVDNGSADSTWDVLCAAAQRDPLRLQVARVETNRAPAGGRNLAVALARAEVVAFTDDDCLPASAWLRSLLDALGGGAGIVQGRTEPDPDGPRISVWDRSVHVQSRSGLFETCNMAYRRADLELVGGFDERTEVIGHRAARPFGEDVVLGWRIEREAVTYAFSDDALVYHRWIPGSYRGWVMEQRQLANFPALARRIPGFERLFWHRIFLTPTSAAFDLGVVAGVTGVALRQPLLLAAAIPWIVRRWRDAAHRSGRPRLMRVAQLGVGDLVGAVSLVEGSLRHRRLVL